MNEIQAQAKTVKQLLGEKYAVDYYQREYRWETKQVVELIDDLTGAFDENHEEGHDRGKVASYGHYFLGPIIVSQKDGKRFIVDGQQRLTTLTLLLIRLRHMLDLHGHSEQAGQLANCIFSERFGKKAFNLDVPERTSCMESLYNGQSFDDADQPESVRNLAGRYANMEEKFQQQPSIFPLFCDWLTERVYLVEIMAYSDEDAYTIFETMNDRGLSLTPTDMLKGYLLTKITDADIRSRVSTVWKKQVGELIEFGKEEEADAIKAWLRGQHAEKMRERKRNAEAEDFEKIVKFHNWVREKSEFLNLNSSDDFAHFIERDFVFYTRWYLRLRNYAKTLSSDFDCVYYNAQHDFTLQYPVLLASLCVTDTDKVAKQKLRVVSAYLDILIHRRIWNNRSTSYSTMQYAMFLVMRDIRRKTASEIADILRAQLDAEKAAFADNPNFALHGMNRRQIHRILARMTDYVEVQSGGNSHYVEYMRRGKDPYEVEHIWANHYNRHKDEFAHAHDFQDYRNRIGDLLLLPKSFNASYGDLPYPEKREHYFGRNLLAKSLHEKCYEHNPGFLRFKEQSGLLFEPHVEFKKADLDARQELYRQLAERIWNPKRLREEADAAD